MATNSAVVGMLRVLLTANSAEFETAMAKASNAAKVWSKDLKQIGRQAQEVGAALTKTLTLPLVAMAAGAAKAAIDFESSFAGVRKTVDGTEADFTMLAASFRALAKEIPINVNELNKIGESAGQLGIKTKNIVGFTEVMAKLGVATNLSSDQAATSLARLANITQMPQQNFDRLGSTIVALGNKFATTESEIVEFGLRIAGAGKQAGMTEPQILAIGTALSSLGVEADAGGTAVQKVILEMVEASVKGAEGFEVFATTAGMSAQQFATLFERDAAGAFQAFVEGLGRQGKNAILTLKELGLQDQRLIRSFLALSGAGDLLSRSLSEGTKAWRENSALTEEARKRFETTASQLTLLWNRLQDVGITIGNALLPAIKGLVGIVGAFIPVIEMLAQTFSVLPGPIQMAAIGLAALVAATGPAIWAFGQLALSASALTGMFTAKGIATRVLTANLASLTTITAGATTVMRTLGAALAAMPVAAITAGIGAIALAVVNLRNRYDEAAQAKARAFREETAKGGAARLEVEEKILALRKALAEAIRNENKVTAAQLERQLSAIEADKERLVILAEIKRATDAGAAATISYADAVTFNANVEAIRLAQWDKSGAAQQKRIEAELALGRITQDQANAQLLALGVERQVADVRKNRVPLAEAVAAAERQIRKELEATGETLPTMLAHLKNNEVGFRKWAETSKLSSEAVKFLEDQLQRQTKTVKESETAAERHAKSLEKQRDALQKLGVVTETTVNDALAEFETLVLHAAAAGVPMDRILAALAPKLAELKRQADGSGIAVRGLDQALEGATRAAARLLTVPDLPFVEGLAELPGTLVQIDHAALIAGFSAQNLADSYKHFGLQTRAELQATARSAVTHFNHLQASGTATPEQIQAAFEKMKTAVNAANGKIPSYWESTVQPALKQALASMTQAVSSNLAEILTGAQGFADGFKDIWQSIKQSATKVFADILDAFINGLMKKMLGAMTGNQSSFASSFAGLFGGGGAASSGLPGTVMHGLTIPGAAGGAGGAAAGTSMLATIAGGAGIGAGGLGLGMLGSKMFGGPGVKSAAFGAGSGAAMGALIGTMVFPVIGTAVGALIGGAAGVIGGLLGGGKGRKSVEEFAQSMGGFDALHRKLLSTLGPEAGERFWKSLTQGVGRNNPEQAKAAIDAITAALGAAEAKQEQFNATLGGMLRQVQALGGSLPSSLQAYLRDLERGGQLTQENIALLNQLSGEGVVSWQSIQEAVNRYGGDISKLGGTFQAQRLHESWQQIIDDIDLFVRGGMSASDILGLTKDKIIELAQQSAQFGTEIPENMRSWIVELIKSGELLDANGEKITDINQLTFGETLQTTLQTLNATLKELVDTFRSVPAAVAAIPRRVDIDVALHPRGTGVDAESLEGAVPGFARGTKGYEDFGRGTLAMLHGWEKITPLGQGGGGGVRDVTIKSQLVLDPFAQRGLAESIARVTVG